MASLTASDIKALEKRYREGVSSSDIVEVFQRAGERFSEATLRKYVQLNLLPKSKRVGTRGKHKGSSGIYPVSVLRIINDVKRALEAGATLEEIRLSGIGLCAEIEELKRAAAELGERLNEAVGHQPDVVQEALVSELFRLKRSLTRQIEEIDEFSGRLSVGQVSL